MISLGKHKILKTALSFKYGNSHLSKWWLKDEKMVTVANSIAETTKNINHHALRFNIEVYKLTDRKAVFRTEPSKGMERSFIAKVFFLNRIEHKFKYHKYGLDEVTNLLMAKARGIKTPEVYGYGHIYDRLGFVKASIIILEELPALSPIGMLMPQKSKEECAEMFVRTMPLFVSLYKANCNHIDINCGAVMLCKRNYSSEVFLLDFQHAKFYTKPSTEILMFEAGCFAKSCRDFVPVETINDWLDKLLTAIKINGNGETEQMRERFNYYFKADLSRKERKKIQ